VSAPLALRPAPEPSGDLGEFCGRVLASLVRSDQRRWGEVYVRGLLDLPGRKSARRIADGVATGTARPPGARGAVVDQSLQQFVNQSPWDWSPVRRRLADQVAAALPVHAWALEEVVFPKNGDKSVGVASQYAPSLRRTLGCQLGLGLFAVAPDGAAALDWRLLLPESWNADADRRRRCRVPAGEHSRSRWRHALDLLDEALGDWRLPPAPVLADARGLPGVEQLLSGLEARRLRYAVRVEPDLLARSRRPQERGPLPPMRSHSRATLWWPPDRSGRPARRQFALLVPAAVGPVRPGTATRVDPRRRRVLLAEWPPGAPAPGALWVCDLRPWHLPSIAGFARLREQALAGAVALTRDHGLRDFEGRSYPGWHHHVTLSSVAHAHRMLAGRDTEPDARRA
jgi:SRSO17 transposase